MVITVVTLTEEHRDPMILKIQGFQGPYKL
jgi:hypothetical protein